MGSERNFDEWVRRRLAYWPTPQIVDFEHWLRERELVEFLPAVREASRHRGVELEHVNGRDPRRRLVDHLVARIKRLVKARTLLQEGGRSVVEIEAHTAEIERLRAELADVVKESAA